MTREEAITTLKEMHESFDEIHENTNGDIGYEQMTALDMAIEALQADAVQGEWIDVENEPYCECSVYGSYIDNLDDDYAFCPRCGARMKGGDNE